VTGRCDPTTGIKPFTALVNQDMATEPYTSARRVFWVVDNGASHRNWAAAARLSMTGPAAFAWLTVPGMTGTAAIDRLAVTGTVGVTGMAAAARPAVTGVPGTATTASGVDVTARLAVIGGAVLARPAAMGSIVPARLDVTH